jgi:arylsulfatase A-like enzyme
MIPVAAVCLFLVLVLAKVLVIGFASPWLFLQDAMVAAIFGLLEVALRGRKWIWIPYGLAVAWIAINVPVGLVLRTWLTWPMLRAAGGPLADSIRYYVTPANIVPLVLVVGAAVVLPLIARRRHSAAVAAALALVALAGTIAPKSTTTSGFDRNALTTLVAGNRGRVWIKTHSRPLFPRQRARQSSVGRHVENRGRELVLNDTRPLFRGVARGMNVVIVILESTAAQYLGLYGAADDPMPNLTKLGADAVVFDAAYAVYPESVKGLYSTLCSRTPEMSASIEASLASPCSSLPRTLGAAGYRTGLFHAGRFGYLGMDALVAQSGFDTAQDAGAIGGVVHSSFGVDESSTVARTIEWMQDAEDSRPFFAMYLPAAGHHPYASTVPGLFKGQTEFDRYRNSIHETDLALGKLASELANPKISRPTLLVVFADHGEAFGQHEGNTGHTLAVWEENIRVPMMVSIPGVTKGQRRVASPASVLDIAPTVLDLAGLNAPPDFEGGSLLEPTRRMAPFFADYSREILGLRDGCWKIQYDRRDERTQLFDLCDDPAETSDVAGRFEAIHDELVKRVEQFFAVRVRPRRIAA